MAKKLFQGLQLFSALLMAFTAPPPSEISMIWMKNGEEMIRDMDYGGILPSGDGTYQTWVSVEPDPQSSDLSSCPVEHCDVQMVLQVPQESETVPLVINAVSGSPVLTIALAGVGLLAWRRRPREAAGLGFQDQRQAVVKATAGSSRIFSETDALELEETLDKPRHVTVQDPEDCEIP